MDAKPVDLLVVDDSAVVRQAMVMLCENERDITVRVAADPLIAMRKIEATRPDVIMLDLEMPRMDGFTFLQWLMREKPIPVVVCSALAGKGTETAFRALEQGAVDVVTKPRVGLSDFLHESTALLMDTIRAAAAARVRVKPAVSRPVLVEARHTSDVVIPAARPTLARTTRKIVAIGASTGGTEALREILEKMPGDAPGIVIVQHMPAVFTAAFAQRLNQSCRIEVKEAADGDAIIAGRALIAPGNRHLIVQRSGAEYRVEILDGPLVSRHRPSVDVLFRSVAQCAGANAVGVILTGMGDDGAAGMLEMKRAGGITLAQDEASSVIFGMPREAILRGAAESVHALGEMDRAILQSVARLRGGQS